jgi:hypothetical protein
MRNEYSDIDGYLRTCPENIQAHLSQIMESSKCPILLALGLRAEKRRQTFDGVRTFAIDICSGVRTNGNLDKQKLTDLSAMHWNNKTKPIPKFLHDTEEWTFNCFFTCSFFTFINVFLSNVIKKFIYYETTCR